MTLILTFASSFPFLVVDNSCTFFELHLHTLKWTIRQRIQHVPPLIWADQSRFPHLENHSDRDASDCQKDMKINHTQALSSTLQMGSACAQNSSSLIRTFFCVMRFVTQPYVLCILEKLWIMRNVKSRKVFMQLLNLS